MAGAAVGYSDFYKNKKAPTPANRLAKPGSPGYDTPEDDVSDDLRKEALKKRLKKNRAAKKAGI